jgi:hypothetical protein
MPTCCFSTPGCSTHVEGVIETSLADVADEIWREYQAVLACSGDSETKPPDERSLAADDAQRRPARGPTAEGH